MADEEMRFGSATKMDDKWARSQESTFLAWCNFHLGKSWQPIDSLRTGLSDGIALIKLVEELSGENLGRFSKKPRHHLHKIENINKALRFLKGVGLRLIGVGAEDIMQGNIKIILGLIWSLINTFQLTDDGDSTSRESLLLWCRSVTKNQERHGVDISNFSTSWTDGMAFCGLLSRLVPGSVDLDDLEPANAQANLKLAFELAEQKLGVPQLLDAEMVAEELVDEQSVITYVSYYRLALQWAEEEGRVLGEDFVEVDDEEELTDAPAAGGAGVDAHGASTASMATASILSVPSDAKMSAADAARIAELEAELAAAREELAATQGKLSDCCSARGTLESDKAKLVDEVAALKGELTKWQADADRFKAAADAAAMAAESAKSAVGAAEEDKMRAQEALLGDLKLAMADKTRLQREADELAALVEKLQRENAGLARVKEENKSLMTDLTAALEENRQLTAELESVREDLRLERASNAKLNDVIKVAEEERRKEKELLDLYQQALESAEAELEYCNEKLRIFENFVGRFENDRLKEEMEGELKVAANEYQMGIDFGTLKGQMWNKKQEVKTLKMTRVKAENSARVRHNKKLAKEVQDIARKATDGDGSTSSVNALSSLITQLETIHVRSRDDKTFTALKTKLGICVEAVKKEWVALAKSGGAKNNGVDVEDLQAQLREAEQASKENVAAIATLNGKVQERDNQLKLFAEMLETAEAEIKDLEEEITTLSAFLSEEGKKELAAYKATGKKGAARDAAAAAAAAAPTSSGPQLAAKDFAQLIDLISALELGQGTGGTMRVTNLKMVIFTVHQLVESLAEMGVPASKKDEVMPALQQIIEKLRGAQDDATSQDTQIRKKSTKLRAAEKKNKELQSRVAKQALTINEKENEIATLKAQVA